MPCYAQALEVTVVILTDSQSPVLSHDVSVFDVRSVLGLGSHNIDTLGFNVRPNGVVTPNQGSTSMAYGLTPGQPPQSYIKTVIGTFTFYGDNFPLGAWPDFSNWAAPPIIDPLYYYLDKTQGMGWVSTPQNTYNYVVQSNYSYTNWAWHSFLGFEMPYTPGASQPGPVLKTITFDLRGGIKQLGCPFCNKGGCTTCGGNAGSNKGMALAGLDKFQAGTAISETALGYTPALGMQMDFAAEYHQRMPASNSAAVSSNLGNQWQSNWISYISGGPANGQAEAVYSAPGGSQYTFSGYEQTVVQGNAATITNQGDFQVNEGWTNGTLQYRQNPERYVLGLPDGSTATFAQATTTAGGRLFFLSLITDPQGLVTTLNYDPTAAANGQALLTSVTDPIGGQLLFSYGAQSPLQITKVTRSSDGLSAGFQYTNGQLTSITSSIGITSSFQYASGTSFINQMTTPYGTTTFNSSDGPSSLEADMTNPLGQNERVEYQESLPTADISDYGAATPTGITTDPATINTASTFYWSRRAISDANTGGIATDSAAFYALAQATHWAQSGQGSIAVPLSTKNRLEGRVWYNYPNQSSIDYVMTNGPGATTSPSLTARLLDSGATQLTQASYNTNGFITQSIDSLGRTTNYTYAANGIDLAQVTQTNGSGQDILSTMTYNGLHEPLTMTDASGQLTSMTYNAYGQLLTRTDALGETTTMAYNSDYFLQTVTGPVAGATTSYTYDGSGRVQTITDSEGYVLTMAYDNLDRPITTTYPDTTTDQTVYHNLDVAQTIDRQGRTTSNQYDLIRELLQTTDPLGRSTKYTWCTCGGLSTLTDANGHVTTWGLDGEGRVTSKTYADSSVISYVYETNTSRLHQMTDAVGNVTVYSYNTDNTLSGTAYTPATGVASTPNVSFTYSNVYNRVASMTDGTGTTDYSYNNVYTGGSPATGGGRLSGVTVPIASTTASVTYTYDALGRVTGRSVDQATTNANNVSSTFDTLGRVTGVTNPLGNFTYAYVDTTSRLSSVTYPSGTGLVTNYSYFGNTGDQRLQELKNLKSGAIMSDFQYTYNPVGTIATWQQQTDSNTPTQYALTYDKADQLINAVQTNTSTEATVSSNAYNYDPAGNRLAETTLSGTTGGQFNSVNQLTALGGATGQTVAGNTSAAVSSVMVNAVPATVSNATNFTASVPLPNGTNVVSLVAQPTASSTPVTTQRVQIVTTGSAPTVLTYDVNGNCTQDENDNTYTWDALNRLIAIVYHSGTNAGNHTEMAYDGLSRRIQIVERSGTTIGSGTINSTKDYLWIGSEMAEERNASNTVIKRFFPQGEQQSGTAYYYSRDHLGSVREMVDSSGNIQARYSYDSFGRTTLVQGANLATFQYAMTYAHQPSGLNLTLFRAFDPNTGRWLSRDPIGEEVGPNLYQYAFNDPADWTDMLGLDPLGHHLVPSAISKAFSQRVQDIWNLAKNRLDATGYKGHNGKPYGGVKCRDYAKAVGDKLNDFLKSLGKNSADDLSDQQLQDFADEIKNTTDGDIGAYNAGVAEEIVASEEALATAEATVEALEVAQTVAEGAVVVGAVVK